MKAFCGLIFVFMLMSLPYLSYGQKKETDMILGDWLTGSGKAKVNIYKDSKTGKLNGKIVWLKDPNEADGTPKLDKHNPNARLKTKPLMGLLLLRDFVHEGGRTWSDGKIYDPENGKDYSCILEVESEKKLKVRGYIGFSLIGRTEYWTR